MKFSLRTKLVLFLSVAAVILTAAVTVISLTLFRGSMIDEQEQMAYSLARMASNMFDPDMVDEYLALGEEAPGYKESDMALGNIPAGSEDVQYVYVYKILEDGCHVVFDPDTEELPGSEPGEIIEFDESFGPYLPALLAGEPIDPVISDEKYGWLLTVYLPVKDSSGATACYVGIDISMPRLRAVQQSYLLRVALVFLGFFIVILMLGIFMANRSIINPVNSMSEAMEDFVSEIGGSREESLERIRALNIHSGDELENLYSSLVTTSEEVVNYIAAVGEKNRQINQMQNGLIMVLADMVESRDKCTGNHVRNTAMYAGLILRQMKKEGIYPDIVTDEYIEDVINSAPLHDVGKITVSDILLNKPGKLTEEEFEEMKKHAAAGGEIIDKAVDMISGDRGGYLAEAKNLTVHHHERWDGTGYPDGIKGEDIPLSARVMAVADVFDALVSKRSYKEGFPFEKAVAIIEEESGTHFDPAVVQAFMHCLDEARKIADNALK